MLPYSLVMSDPSGARSFGVLGKLVQPPRVAKGVN